MIQAIPVSDSAIDVTGEICPMTYVRTRLALDRLLPGQHLLVTLLDGEALRNVPEAARLQGHQVVSRTIRDGRKWDIIIRKRQPGPAS